MQAILITGAFGFVGTNISKSLKKSFKQYLIAVDINEPANHVYDKYFSWNDLYKIDWCKFDVIIHLGGKAHDINTQTITEAYFEIKSGLTE